MASSVCMRHLFSALFWPFFVVSSLVCLVIAVALAIVTWPFDRDRRINHLFSCAWAWLYATAYPGWHVRVLGRKNIEPKKPYVIVANHTSIADIVLCFGLFKQFKWVSKASMFKAPILGWNMRICRYIPLVRGDKASIAVMLEQARSWLARGISVMMFPEGTRSPDGELKAFKLGAFSLAKQMNVPVVPVAIHGGYGLIPKHGAKFATRADLWVEILPPISPDGFATPEAFAEGVRNVIAKALAQPPQPAPAPARAAERASPSQLNV